MRLAWLPRALAALTAVALTGCPKPEPEAPQLAAPAADPAPHGATAGYRLPRTDGAICEYTLKDILTETLGDQLVAGHQVDVRFSLRTTVTATGALSYTLAVKHVHVEGKREAYTVKLDSEDHAQMVRMRGGGDTLLLFDAVLYFALLGRPLSFEVSPTGHLRAVRGGEAVRAAYLALHPPKPREDPHQRARVEVALSDENLARRFLPAAALVPAEGALHPQALPPSQGPHDFAEFPADMMRAARVRWVGEHLVIEEKRAFGPTARAATMPPATGFPKVSLRSGEDQTTVALSSESPCYVRAATTYALRTTWQGMLQEEEITTEQRREGTWLVQPADAPPVIDRPASRPAPTSAHPGSTSAPPAKGAASKPAHP